MLGTVLSLVESIAIACIYYFRMRGNKGEEGGRGTNLTKSNGQGLKGRFGSVMIVCASQNVDMDRHLDDNN